MPTVPARRLCGAEAVETDSARLGPFHNNNNDWPGTADVLYLLVLSGSETTTTTTLLGHITSSSHESDPQPSLSTGGQGTTTTTCSKTDH